MRGNPLRATVLALAAVVVACGGATPSAAPVIDTTGTTQQSAAVTVGTSAFSPSSITIPVNSTVTWNWDSCTGDAYSGQMCVSHSVAFDDTTLAGSAVQSSGSFSAAFRSKGVYTYHCSVHGTAMSGKVTVQ